VSGRRAGPLPATVALPGLALGWLLCWLSAGLLALA
jgi:hypothetical protein